MSRVLAVVLLAGCFVLGVLAGIVARFTTWPLAIFLVCGLVLIAGSVAYEELHRDE